MKPSFSFLILLYASFTWAQKPPIDTSAIRTWASIGTGAISNDGNYVWYNTYNQPTGSRKLTIKSTTTNWKREFESCSNVTLTNNSKLAIFQKGIDSLCILQLGRDNISYITNATKYKVSQNDQDIWLTYYLKAKEHELVLRNLNSNKERAFSLVTACLFSPNGKYLLLEKQERNDNGSGSVLQMENLSEEKINTVWRSSLPEVKPGNYAFDINGDQLAFIIQKQTNTESGNELWYYDVKSNETALLSNNQTIGLENGLGIADQTPDFSSDGNLIYFGLQSVKKRKPKPDAVQVDIWSYKDAELQSLQLSQVKREPVYMAVLNIPEKKTFRVEYENETIVSRGNGIVLIKRELGYYGRYEANWNADALSAFYLVSTKDGSRKLFKENIISPNEDISLSPAKRWLVYYDMKAKNYFSYEIHTGITRNITKDISTIWTDEENDNPLPPLTWGSGRKTWLDRDKSVLIYDTYDIWQIDPSGTKLPINLTNGFGRKHNIKFELIIESDNLQNIASKNKPFIILKAFNRINKNYGFYRKRLGTPGDPELLSTGPYVYGWWDGYGGYNYPPIKAKNKDTYLVIRMSAIEAPNYFTTIDFKKFNSLTDIQPQKNFSWLTTELVNWRTFDGSASTGILYKPENFNPRSKYPIIFDCYERRSDELNLYISPTASEDRINISFYVSNGYLVFAPDIHYKKGEPGQSAYNAIASAANYLSAMPWIDRTRMGIQGHSFGGYEINFTITKTNIFAAACVASGISNLISWYGAGSRGGYPMYWAEKNQGRMGATPWQMQDLYLKNSPVLNVDKVNTPLLMMHNKEDRVVPFSQGVEFFTALRRLRKKVWMLQYDAGEHSLNDSKSAIDFTIRMKQFFDHYLKGAPSPKWMSQGLPANMKGIDDGLALDEEVSNPEDSLDARMSNKK